MEMPDNLSYRENLTSLKMVAAFPLISVSFHLLFVVSAVRDASTRPPEMVTPGQEMASSYLRPMRSHYYLIYLISVRAKYYLMCTRSIWIWMLFMKVAIIVSQSSLFNFSSCNDY